MLEQWIIDKHKSGKDSKEPKKVAKAKKKAAKSKK